jgi:O-antigen/teichoic acid export membrane protein
MAAMRKSLSTNVTAGAISSLVSILAAVIATPLYLRILGAEAFGVLGFVLSLQAAILALDAGLAVSATRAVAQAQTGAAGRSTTDLMYGLARASWYIAFIIAGTLALLASSLAASWLNLFELPEAHVAQSLAIASIAIGARWPLALYQGILTGAQRLVALSAVNILMTVLSTGGAVVLMLILGPDLRVLFAWFAGAALVQVLWCRQLALQALGDGRLPARGAVRAFFRASAAAGWLGLVGLLLMQIDKVVLSKMLPASQFGYYVMAGMVAGALYGLVMPVFNVLYPRFATLASMADTSDLRRLYRDSSLAVSTLLFPLAAVLAFFGDSVLLLWTGDPVAAQAASPILMMLALGSAVHGVMFLPYALKLACGASRLALGIGLTLLLLSLPAMIAAAARWGGTGAAGAWLTLTVFYLVAGSAVTHIRLMPGLGNKWLLFDVAPPALLSLISAYAVAMWTTSHAWSAGHRAMAASALVICCWVLVACSSTRLRLVARPWGAHTPATD